MRVLCLLFVIIVPTLSSAQIIIGKDTLKTSFLDELVISANKIKEPRRHVAQQVQLIDSLEIQLLNPQTSADLLQNSGTVFVQRSQQGGGSPSLRGFEASRVLLVIDGVRMNNAIYRSGHLQNAITIDNNILSSVEVLFGPSSTVYGSDALGGVVHFYTRDPILSTTGIRTKSNAFVRYASVNQERAAHVDFTFGGKQIGMLTSFTASKYGDLKMGKRINQAWGKPFGLRNQYAQWSPQLSKDTLLKNENPYNQKFSGYTQYDILHKILVKHSSVLQSTFNFQYSTSSNIPRYDRLTDEHDDRLKYTEWYYGPQKRLLGNYKFAWTSKGLLTDQVTANISFQQVEESRHNRQFNSPDRTNRMEQVRVWALTIDAQKKSNQHTLRYGFDSQLNFVKSRAFLNNIQNGSHAPLDTRYPDGENRLHYWAFYLSHTWKINPQITLIDGIRFGGSDLRATFLDKSFFPFPFNDIHQKTNYLSGNLGLIYAPSSWKISLLGSSGYRVPNIDDLSKVFDSTPQTLIVPNPNLKPEKTLNVDCSVMKFFGHRARVEGVFFLTNFFDAIVVRPDLFNGSPTVQYEGQLSRVMSNQNAGRAYLYGFSLLAKWELFKGLSINGSYNYTRGRVRNADHGLDPLDHVPPEFGRIAIHYEIKRWLLDISSQYNGWKRLKDYSPSGEDNERYATSKGMPSWITFNANVAYNIHPKITIQAGVDNIFDLQYRVFASGINAPGRNFKITLRAGL